MLKNDERQMLVKFIGYHLRELIAICTEKGCKYRSILRKINSHKTAEGNYKESLLTKKEFDTLKHFIYSVRSEFFTWCNSYQISQKCIEPALRRMTYP